MTDGERLVGLVRRVRRRTSVVHSARAILAFLLGMEGGAVLSAGVLPWLTAAWRSWALLGCLAIGALSGLLFAARQARVAKPLVSWEEATRILAAAHDDREDLVHTGADLASWGDSGAEARGASAELRHAQVALAWSAARELDPRRVAPAGPLIPWSAGCAAALFLLVTGYGLNPWGVADAWRGLLAERPLAKVTVGNLKVRYEPPAYAGLPGSTADGASGAVEGLKGTRVTLEGELSGPADAGQWEDSNGRRIALEVQGRSFRVSWILDHPGSYGLSFQRGGRPLPSDFQPQPLAIREDERPKVRLIAPDGDLEVRSDGEVEVRFAAVDDFRVERAEIVLQGDQEVRIPVAVTAGRSVEGSGAFVPVAYPQLGGGANLRVEAWDSDTVSGPKAGASRSIYVTFLDKKTLLADIQGLEERLLEALLMHLADHLELPAGDDAALARLRLKADDLLRLFASLAARVNKGAEEGALGAVAVLRIEDGLRSTLGPFAGGSGNRQKVIPELERDALFLDRLLRNVRMEETLDLGDELSALQRSLFDQLNGDASSQDLLRQIDQMESLLRRMAEKLSRGSTEMPDAFANADAVKDAPSSELQETLQKLKKALREGDREAAKRLAEKLLDTLGRWMAALEDAAEAAAGGQVNPILRDLAKVDSDLRALVGNQEEVLRGTRAVADEASRKVMETMKGEIRSLIQREEQRLNLISEYARRLEGQVPAPPPPGMPHPGGSPLAPPAGRADLFDASRRVSSAVAEMRQALRKDLGRARSGAEALGGTFGALREQVMKRIDAADGRREVAERYGEAGRREVEALRRDLEALDRLRMRGLGPKEQRALRELEGDQRMLRDRTGGLAERLENLARRTPFLGPGLPERARSAGNQMGGAGAKLGKGDAFGALAPEESALEGLSEISRKLEDARRQMQQASGRGSFQTIPSPGSSVGGRQVDRSRVEIPKEAEARELKTFREEVLKAMRRGKYPRNYEEEVERYYERLIR